MDETLAKRGGADEVIVPEVGSGQPVGRGLRGRSSERSTVPDVEERRTPRSTRLQVGA